MADLLNKLNSANYVTVKVTDNAIVNGNNLLAAYALAKTVTPNGAALSDSNRLAVILPPAVYDLGTQSLVLNRSFIDIIGSTNDRNMHYIKSSITSYDNGVIKVSTSDIKLMNFTVQILDGVEVVNYDSFDPAALYPNAGGYYELIRVNMENIEFIDVYDSFNDEYHAFSMRNFRNQRGYFKDCIAGGFSFSGGTMTSAVFINCIGGNYSFYSGGGGGTYENCSGGYGSFNDEFSTPNINATYTNCSGGDYSFGGESGYASGIFKNCKGGNYSFAGSGGTANGTFRNCIGGIYSFGGSGTASGNFTDCTGGDYSFGGDGGTANGTFINCSGEYASFGGGGATATGTFAGCTGGDYSFGGGGGTASGDFKDCTGGEYSFGGDSGTASGTFTNCTGGIGSFNL